MRYFVLLSCFYLYVTKEHYLLVCEPEKEEPKPLIEVIEGDGYDEPRNVTYDDLVDTFNNQLFDKPCEY